MEDNISYVEAICTDINGIYQCNLDSLPVVYSKKEYIKFILDKNHIVYIAKLNDSVIGYLLINKEYDRSNNKYKAHIMSLAICNKHRKKGIGRKLVDTSCKDAIKRFNVDYVTLYVMKSNKNAISFYKKIEYNQKYIIPNYYGKNNDGIMMIKYY